MTDEGKLRHYYDVTPVDVQPRQYTDVWYDDCRVADMIPDGVDNRGRMADWWVKDIALTKKHKINARKDGSVTKDCVYVPRIGVAFDIETANYTEYTGLRYTVRRKHPGRQKNWCLRICRRRRGSIKMRLGRRRSVKLRVCEGYMYHAQIAIGTTVIHCRYWWQVMDVWQTIARKWHLLERHRGGILKCRVWDANLGFEFAYIARRVEWVDIFAAKLRKPITAETSHGYVLQDALMISGGSLESLASDYALPSRKTHDLDHTKIRHAGTPMTEEELRYCSLDVRILSEYNEWLMTNYQDNGLPIPITKTQMLRDSIKKCFNDTCLEKGRLSGFGKRLPDLHFEDYDTYSTMMRFCFRGGYTHCNHALAGDVQHHVGGWDFTSSYPYCMIFGCDYPLTKFMDTNISCLDDVQDLDRRGYAVIVHVTLYDVKNRTEHSLESISKTEEYVDCRGRYAEYLSVSGAVVDNGRILQAHQMTVWMTEIDYRLYRMMYRWDDSLTVIHRCMAAGKGMLPDYVRWPCMVYYERKCQLKRAGKGKTTAYQLAKQLANSGYGMMCERLHLSDIIYDTQVGWKEIPPGADTVDDDYISEIYGDQYLEGHGAPRKKLPAVWGIYTTAMARYNLLVNLVLIGHDAIYCDTDSVYVLHPERYQSVIDDYNCGVMAKNKRLIMSWNDAHKKHAFMRPIDETVFIDLGCFDPICESEAGVYDSFKALGAKRYIKTSGNETESTIAGLPKTALIEYCGKGDMDIYTVFKDDMQIPACKRAHCYNDTPHGRCITDYMGNTMYVEELTSCGIFEIDFSMGIDSDYLVLIRDGIDAIRKKYYKGEYSV